MDVPCATKVTTMIPVKLSRALTQLVLAMVVVLPERAFAQDPLFSPDGLPPYDTTEILRLDDDPDPDAAFDPALGAKAEDAWERFTTRTKAHGLDMVLAYSVLYQRSSRAMKQKYGFSGDFDFQGRWSPEALQGDYDHSFVFRFEGRNKIGSYVPADLADSIGAQLSTTTYFYNQQKLSLVEIFWEAANTRTGFFSRIGKQDPGAIYNTTTWGDPESGFLGEGVVGAAAPLPDLGWGATFRVKPSSSTYVSFGLHDANGDPTELGFGSLKDAQFFTAAEVGFIPGAIDPDGPTGKYSMALWYSDELSDPSSTSGYGIAFTVEKELPNNPDIVPFFRYSWSDGAAAAKQQVSGGVVFQNVLGQNDDIVGLAASWVDPANTSFRNETTLEAFYRVQVTPNLAITPDLQVILNPAKTKDYDEVYVWSLRARWVF